MIRISVIVDSSIIVSAYNTKDQNHEKGLKIITDIENEKYGKDIFLPDFVFDETMTAIFTKTKDKKIAQKVGSHLLISCDILKVKDNTFMKAFEIFCEENALSFTDCTLLSMANTYGIEYIATFDKEIKKHFKNCVDS